MLLSFSSNFQSEICPRGEKVLKTEDQATMRESVLKIPELEFTLDTVASLVAKLEQVSTWHLHNLLMEIQQWNLPKRISRKQNTKVFRPQKRRKNFAYCPIHLKRCGLASFHQNCYFDEHPPPLWGVKAFEQQGAGGSSHIIEPFNPDPETSGSNNSLALPCCSGDGRILI